MTLETAERSVTMTAEDAKKAIRVIDQVTGEIRDKPRQASLAGLANIERRRNYRVQVTVTTETEVTCQDESAAAEIGVADIDAGCGEVIKRQVAVTYLRPKD
jgi:hypothetical protein